MITEQEFLKNYNIGDYDRPSVTADVVIFRMRTVVGNSFRKDPKSVLSVLLIRRGEHPFLNEWALPGGFVRMTETVEACALREAQEETDVTPNALLYLGVFSAVDRDPRGRIISNAFTCILNGDAAPTAGSDASDARWFDVSFREDPDGSCLIRLQSDEIGFDVHLSERRTAYGTAFTTEDRHPLAFDHASILATALKQLRERAARFEVIFDFLPAEFTLFALQNVQETLTGIPVAPANFRRKVADFVEETENFTQGAGHRPAKLYTRKNGTGHRSETERSTL